MPDLNLQMPTVPEGFCNSLGTSNWVQVLLNLIGTGVAKFEGSGFTAILNQATAPGVADQGSLWRDTDDGRIYAFSGGAWVSQNPVEASGYDRRLFKGTLTQLLTYDGGAVGAVFANTGPMWEEDTDYQGRSPMGPGDVPNASPAKNLALSEAYGSGVFAMTDTNSNGIVTHTHVFGRMHKNYVNDDFFFTTGNVSNAALTGPYVLGADVADTANPAQTLGAGTISGAVNAGPYLNTGPMVSSAGTTPTTINIAVVHPVVGTYVIKRTARVNYVGA